MHYSEIVERELRDAQIVTKGHAAHAPGLRGHSLGETYPYTVIVIGDPHAGPGALRYAVMDCRTGRLGHERPTYRAAAIDMHAVRVRNLINE